MRLLRLPRTRYTFHKNKSSSYKCKEAYGNMITLLQMEEQDCHGIKEILNLNHQFDDDDDLNL